MITTKQKIALGALFPVAAAVWGPQALEMVQGEETKSQVGVDAPSVHVDGGAPMGAYGPDGGADPGAMPGAPVGPGPGADPTMGTDMSMDMGMDMGGPSAPTGAGSSPTASGDVGDPSAVLDDVLKALRGADAFRAGPAFDAGTPTFNAGQPGSGTQYTRSDRQPTATPIDAFLSANPLRGTLTGTDDRYALLGSHRLHEGDPIPGTFAVLTSVKRGHVVLTIGEETVELDLPPLRADPSRARKSQNDGAGQPDTDPNGSAGAPASSDQPTADAGGY